MFMRPYKEAKMDYAVQSELRANINNIYFIELGDKVESVVDSCVGIRFYILQGKFCEVLN